MTLRDLTLHPTDGREDPLWEEFLDGPTDGTLFHRPSFLAYHPEARFRVHWLRAVRRERTLGVIPLAEAENDGGTFLASPYGGSFGGWATRPGLGVADHVELLEALADWTGERGFGALVISSRPVPYRTNGDGAEFALAARGARVVARDITHIAPLHGNEEDLVGRLRGTSRRGARKAERLGTTVRRGTPDDLARCHALLVEDRSRVDARPTHDLDELEWLWRSRPDDITLWLAENDGELVGGALTFRATPQIALGFYTARSSAPEAERCMNLVNERCLIEAQAEGLAWFDFGTSSIGGQLNVGLSEFKEGFGARPFVRETWRLELG